MSKTKKFFWKDKSGRDFSNTLTEKELIKAFTNKEGEDDTSDDGETITEWLENADEGDVWQNAANHVTRIK